MRIKIFLLKASCILLSAFLICGKTAPIAYCQQLVAGFIGTQPEFINGLVMDLHQKTAIISHIVDPYKIIDKTTTAGTDKKKAEELINYILKKNSPPPGKDTVAATTSTLTAQNNDTPATVAIRPDAIEINENTLAEISKADKALGEEPGVSIDDEIDPLINKYAEMISVEPQDISNYPLYRFIDKWYGTPYKWGGTDNTGIDCSAFSQKLYGEIYGTDLTRTSRQQHRKCEQVKHYADANEGDLIFFRIHRIRISHVGIYLANGYFVHASRSHGVMISSLNDKYWHRRYAGCGRVAREDRSATESDFLQ